MNRKQFLMMLAVVAVFFHRRFQNEGFFAKLRVGEDAAKPVKTNIAFADMLVPVDVRA